MNRDIKFRARRMDDTVHNGKWVYGHYFTPPLTDENSGLPPETGWFFLSGGEQRHCIEQDGVVYTVDPKTVGQFTGLPDKNGVEIYEGDIVREKIGFGTESRAPKNKPHVFTLGVVAWFEDHWGISHEMNHDQYWDDVRGNATDWYRVHYGLKNTEVIGNIHEHSHLLQAR